MFSVNYFCRSCCLSQKCYSAIIVVIGSGVEREEGLPLLANPREKPSMLGGHDSFDCPRTVSCDSYPSRHSLPSVLGLVLSRSNHPRSYGSRNTRSAVLAAKTSWRAHAHASPSRAAASSGVARRWDRDREAGWLAAA